MKRKDIDELISGVEVIGSSSTGLGEGLGSPMAGGVGGDTLSLPEVRY